MDGSFPDLQETFRKGNGFWGFGKTGDTECFPEPENVPSDATLFFVSTPELPITQALQLEPVVSVAGVWIGLFWGTSRGIARAELTVNNGVVAGRLMLTESVGAYQADVAGRITAANALEADLRAFSSESVTGLPTTGRFTATYTETDMDGEWEANEGSGKLKLLREVRAGGTGAAQNSAFITKNIELGCYRLDQTALINLVKAVHDGTNVSDAAVGVSWGGHTIARGGVQGILDDGEIPSVVRNLSIAVNEPLLNCGTRSIFLNLKEKEPSSLVVNGSDSNWVEGKAARIKRVLSLAEVKSVKYARKYGPEVNSIVFLALVAFLPSVDSLWHRAQIVIATILLLLSLLFIWRLPSNTKVFLREPKPSWWKKNGTSLLLVLLSATLSGIVAFLVKKYVRGI